MRLNVLLELGVNFVFKLVPVLVNLVTLPLGFVNVQQDCMKLTAAQPALVELMVNVTMDPQETEPVLVMLTGMMPTVPPNVTVTMETVLMVLWEMDLVSVLLINGELIVLLTVLVMLLMDLAMLLLENVLDVTVTIMVPTVTQLVHV
jgi:hypothetical protein